MNTATMSKERVEERVRERTGTMTADELNVAIDQCGSVFIGVRFDNGGEVRFIRWRDKSMAIRRKVRALARDVTKLNPNARFAARIADTGGIEKTLIIGA